jgi:peptidoglycan/xylan/chitin deacetylase (PgdA/CDA1 family)
MKYKIASRLQQVDHFIARQSLGLMGEKPSLIALIFHSIFRNADEMSSGLVDPQQEITTETLRQIITYFQEQGYSIVSPADILGGLEENKNHLLLTFDDGYYNNLLALDILREFEAPATFFISTDFVQQMKSFWWDVIYRERIKQGASLDLIRREQRTMKDNRYSEIEAYLIDSFGRDALLPINDLDRPFTPAELREFADDPLVTLGNHTASHAILTNYSKAEMFTEIQAAQEGLWDITGKVPVIISYPNGNINQDVLSATIQTDLKLGITLIQEKNSLPIRFEGYSPYLLKRYFVYGFKELRPQLESFRSGVHLMTGLKKLLRWRNNVLGPSSYP